MVCHLVSPGVMNSLGTPQSAEVLDEREIIPERPLRSSGQDDKT